MSMFPGRRLRTVVSGGTPAQGMRPGLEELEIREVLSGFTAIPLEVDPDLPEIVRFLPAEAEVERGFALAPIQITPLFPVSELPPQRFLTPIPVDNPVPPPPNFETPPPDPIPPDPIPPSGPAIVNIDSAWLASRGTGPLLLDQANTTYVLQTDVRTAGTAFVVGAADVTLDLNGHTIIYGDSSPMPLLNGGFEVGEGRNVPGWDLSDAPAAQIADNTSLLFGDKVLRLGSFAGVQRIVSDPIALSEIGRPYTATITPSGNTSRSTVTLSVLDAVTGQVLSSGTSAAAFRGFSAVSTFTPTTSHPVRLRIEVRPGEGEGLDALDLDQVTLTTSGDRGILATRASSTEILGWPQLPDSVRSVYRLAENFTVRNGTIRQGQADGYASTALDFRYLPGVTVENIETFTTGTDTLTIDATLAREQVTIRGSTFNESIDTVTDRMDNHATIRLNRVRANILVENNHLLGSPQIGIGVARSAPEHSVIIRGNEIRQHAVATNGYGILFSGVQNFEIANNVIIPVNGKGIDLDGYSEVLLGNGRIFGNHVEVREVANREYPVGLDAVALRLRNNIGNQGRHQNLSITDNAFIAHTGPGLVESAYGVRISYGNEDGRMRDANISLERNLIRAIVASSDPIYRGGALRLEQLDPGIGVRFEGNVLESNDVSFAIASAGVDTQGVDPVRNVLRVLTDQSAREYRPIVVG